MLQCLPPDNPRSVTRAAPREWHRRGYSLGGAPHRPSAGDAAAPHELHRHGVRPPRVLLVDDFADAREMYAYYLQRAGYEVDTAENGQEALTKVAAQRPDLILLDVSMPGMSGWQVTQILKGETDTAAIPIVILTAHDSASERLRCVSEGCQAFLAKPCTPRALSSEVARALGQAPPAH